MRTQTVNNMRLRMRIKALEQRYKHKMSMWDKFVFMRIAKHQFTVYYTKDGFQKCVTETDFDKIREMVTSM